VGARRSRGGWDLLRPGDLIAAHAEKLGDGRCLACRADILPLDREAFNHTLARFSRTGKHAGAACDECHKRPATASAPAHVQFAGSGSTACRDGGRQQARAGGRNPSREHIS